MNRVLKVAKSELLALRSGYLVYVLAAHFFVLTALVGSANAQSKDRNKPTLLTSKEISGLIGNNRGATYFYKSIAGPGEVTVTLGVEAGRDNPANAVTFELFDGNDKLLTHSSVMAFRGQIAQEAKSISITRRQLVLLRITILDENLGPGKYKLSLSGAVTVFSGGIGDVSLLLDLENSNAQNQASSPTQNASSQSSLGGTEWKWQERGKFFYVFPIDKPGIVISLIPFETLNINLDVVTDVLYQVGSFKQEGDSVRLEFSDHYIVATIKGNNMEGEITDKKSNQKSKWLIQRMPGKRN